MVTNIIPDRLPLPAPLQRSLDRTGLRLLQPDGGPTIDFRLPAGEAALVGPDSVSWRVFKNPVSLFIGGVAAVILELAEPGVRSGVWEHSTFRTDPMTRLQRTGLAAMVTVYGAQSIARPMIERVVRRHDRVSGHLPDGQRYRANDVAFLDWVQATATFGFGEAYSRYVARLSAADMDRLFAEAKVSAGLYGATGAPASWAQWQAQLETMKARLEPHPIVHEFLDIIHRAEAFPGVLKAVQPMLIRAAVDMTPDWVRARLGLNEQGLKPWERPLVHLAGIMADRIVLPSGPAVQSCLRLGLPQDYLYRRV
ncbi:oxygenase MpaB family protein [Asticcacaulis sp. ZE23SCel15]|uniref:oxygenase MpaB family protein n=1 Tax=Asticcacaulis sp. ZE23SCel15 TaxID=3059027 RepID=UPI00265DF96C|nr:oxygenase MpaB family protein [Asticcacaulis sp. ZE23SCel15]WKL58760.1 oxygenase MpaB family protein [Asticcacaulis sp. ZE23SCel15]